MMSDVVEYDKMGFVPSVKVETLDGYLRESEMKQELMEKSETSPESYVGGECRVKRLQGNALEHFCNRFKTNPFPTVFVPRDVLRKKKKSSFGNKSFLRTDGTIFYLEEGLRLRVPIVANDTSSYEDSLEEFCIMHESLHSIRDQWRTKLFYREGMVEEAMAYLVHTSPEFTRDRLVKFGMKYSSGETLASIPFCLMGGGVGLINSLSNGVYFDQGLLSGICVGGGSVLTFGLAVLCFNYAALVPRLIKGKKLIQKGLDEKVSMSYLFLRSNFHEFNLEQSLEEQIARKKGVRWDVMRIRCGIDKAKS